MISQSEQGKHPRTQRWRDMTRQLHRAVESIFRKAFSNIAKSFSNFSVTNQSNQSGRFPVLQEEELER